MAVESKRKITSVTAIVLAASAVFAQIPDPETLETPEISLPLEEPAERDPEQGDPSANPSATDLEEKAEDPAPVQIPPDPIEPFDEIDDDDDIEFLPPTVEEGSDEIEMLPTIVVEASADIETLPPVIVEATADTGASAVFGVPLAENPLRQFAGAGTTVLGGAELRRKLGATLGETLASEPGISASSYSPGVSRPVIRGFEGVRVRTLRDGLGTMDLSEDSPDHGVLIDTLMAEEVEIYRGPSSLLFGNSAIGGAINTRTRYIPSVDDGEPLAATVIGGYDTQGDGYRFGTAAEVRRENFALGFSASERSAGDISIPGRARTSGYEALAQPRVFVPGVGTVPVPNPDGTLPNSFHESASWSLGARLGSEEGLSLGLSHHHFETTYGLPYYFPGDETDFFGDHSIEARLDRTDLDLGYTAEPGSWLHQSRLRVGFGDYAHDENFLGRGKDQGRGFTENAFQRDTFESRLEFYHGEEEDAFSGVFGAHFTSDELGITRLVVPPPTPFEERSTLESRGLGLFALEKWSAGPLSLQAGLRWDRSDVSVTDQLDSSLSEKGSSFSQSLSASYEFADPGPLDILRTSFTASHVERLPTAIERYAFYNNAALGRFLIGGDLDGTPLDSEESTGFEFALDAERGNVRGNLSLFYYQFENYIYLQDQRGVSFVPTAQYVQTAADFYGLEASLTRTLIDDPDGSGTLDLRFVGDVIRGVDTDRSDAPLPRVPAARLGMELIWEHPRWSAALETRYVFEQDRTASFPTSELPTDDYLMVNASVTWSPLAESDDLQLSLRLNNLLNVEARDHTSFRKDTSPHPGFGLSTEVRWSF